MDRAAIRFGRAGDDFVAMLGDRTRHIRQRFLAGQANVHRFPRLDAFQEKLGFDKRHRTNVAGDVKMMVSHGAGPVILLIITGARA